MSRKSHPMAVALELIAQGDEWLDIASAADHLDDNIERDVPRDLNGDIGGRVFSLDGDQSVFEIGGGNYSTQSASEFRIGREIDTAICS